MLVIASFMSGRVHVLFPVVYDVLQGVAFLYYWPTLLALVSQAAPRKLKSTLMGVAFLSLFVANTTIGRLGSYYETLGPRSFWTLHAGIAVAGALLAMVFGPRLARVLTAGTTTPVPPVGLSAGLET